MVFMYLYVRAVYIFSSFMMGYNRARTSAKSKAKAKSSGEPSGSGGGKGGAARRKAS